MASAIPQNVGVVLDVIRSTYVAGWFGMPVSPACWSPSPATSGKPNETGGSAVSTTISSSASRPPTGLGRSGRIDHLHAGGEEVAAVVERERRVERVGVEIEHVDALDDRAVADILPRVADRRLRCGADLLPAVFALVEDRDAEAGR